MSLPTTDLLDVLANRQNPFAQQCIFAQLSILLIIQTRLVRSRLRQLRQPHLPI